MDCNPSLNKSIKQYAHNTPYSELNITFLSTNRINNRGEGKEQYKRPGSRNGIKQNTKWNETKQEMAQQKKRISFTDALSFIVMRCD